MLLHIKLTRDDFVDSVEGARHGKMNERLPLNERQKKLLNQHLNE